LSQGPRDRRPTGYRKLEANGSFVEELEANAMTLPEKHEANGASPDERADEARSGDLLSGKRRSINRVSGRAIRIHPAAGVGDGQTLGLRWWRTDPGRSAILARPSQTLSDKADQKDRQNLEKVGNKARFSAKMGRKPTKIGRKSSSRLNFA
jgi:hypothetical protein